MTIWHWIIVAVLLAIAAVCIGRVWKANANAAPVDLTGVGGWLAFLVVALTFLGPLFGAARLNSDLLQAEREAPQLLALAAWGTYKSAVWITFGLSALVSIYAGSRLGFTRRRAAVPVAIVALWASGPGASLVMLALLPVLIFGRSAFGPQEAGGLMGTVVAAGIWTAYLLKSKRVKARYVEEAEGAAAAVAPAD